MSWWGNNTGPWIPPYSLTVMEHLFRSSKKQTSRQEACKGFIGELLVRNKAEREHKVDSRASGCSGGWTPVKGERQEAAWAEGASGCHVALRKRWRGQRGWGPQRKDWLLEEPLLGGEGPALVPHHHHHVQSLSGSSWGSSWRLSAKHTLPRRESSRGSSTAAIDTYKVMKIFIT